MPFTPITEGSNKGKYSSPSGRIFNKAQIKLYYASNRFDKKKLASMHKAVKNSIKR